MFAELLFPLAYFAARSAPVLAAGALVGWGRLFGSHSLIDRLGTAAALVCRGGTVLLLAGLVIAFTGYGFGHALTTRIGAIMIALSLPLILIAEHVGTNGVGRVR